MCDQFPRYSEYYGEIKESGIGLACEEAERIIFSENKTFTTVLKPCDEEYSEDMSTTVLTLSGYSRQEMKYLRFLICRRCQLMRSWL